MASLLPMNSQMYLRVDNGPTEFPTLQATQVVTAAAHLIVTVSRNLQEISCILLRWRMSWF